MVSVVVYSIDGMSKYVIGVYGKSCISIPEDALAMHIAMSTGVSVITGDKQINPYTYLRCSPDGTIDAIDVDIERLDEHGVLQYKIITEQDAEGKP